MARDTSMLSVEFYGLPALLAGRRRVEATAPTLRALVQVLAERFPALLGTVIDPSEGWLNRGYVFVVDGRFTRDPETELRPGTEVLLVAAQAGGVR
ncbi:MAG: MoaD/ThiS family protein [Thermomicrobium sp.]|nr:MoaD/ThiS family protein [Thermomicrobium sp.]MDW8059280.1 MoaD/ThiS family protein [Thermomicrobium sp.]